MITFGPLELILSYRSRDYCSSCRIKPDPQLVTSTSDLLSLAKTSLVPLLSARTQWQTETPVAGGPPAEPLGYSKSLVVF